MKENEIYEFLKEERDYLKTTIILSEKKLNRNKEKLKIVEQALKEQLNWVESGESTHVPNHL